jgi:hypothetical protein
MRTGRRFRFEIFITAFTLLPLAGCFDTANPSELHCTQNKYCPDGYVCVGAQPGSTGRCQKPADGGWTDVAIPADGASAFDAPRSPDASVAPDGPALPGDGPISGVDSTATSADQAWSFDTATGPDGAPDIPLLSDLGPDVGSDLPPATLDSAVDSPQSAPDLAPEKAPDVRPDFGPDVPPALGPDTSPDLGPDAAPQLGPDTAPDLGPDAAPDLGPDAAPDLGPDAPTTKTRGSACTQGSECADGFCEGKICCNRACSGACEECTAASHGVCSYKSGTECLAATNCMNAAVCSGSSSICPTPTPKPAGTPCGTITCSGSTQSGPSCNGSGSCGASTNKECYPYACVPGSGCKTSCATNADCVGGNSAFCGKTGACTVDSKCWHVTDGSSTLLWQVNPKETADPANGPYDPQYHRYSDPGSTPSDVCSTLTLCGFSDWTVPTISELRSLVRGCPSTVTGGTCGVTDICLGTDCDGGCSICDNSAGPGSDGCYWPEGVGGPCFVYWSSSVYFDSSRQSYRYRFANFSNGSIASCDPSDGNYVRCVRHSQ